MNPARDRAVGLLQHYLLRLQGRTDRDCFVEVEQIVDDIIEAVLDEVRRELLEARS